MRRMLPYEKENQIHAILQQKNITCLQIFIMAHQRLLSKSDMPQCYLIIIKSRSQSKH